MLRTIMLLLVLGGCLNDHLVQCGDRTCPTGYACDVERSFCIEPSGLSVPPAVIDFANVPCGTTANNGLSIRNFSDGPIQFSAVSTIPGVTVTPAAGTFPTGPLDLMVEAAVAVESVPASPIQGSLLIATGDGVIERAIEVTASGAVLGASVQQLDFGEGTVGVMDKRSISFSNTGNTAIDLVPSLETPTVAFALDAAPVHVQPGATSDLDVTFVPQNLVMASNSVHVAPTGSLCQLPPAPIAVTGVATLDEILVDHLTLDYGDARCGDPLSALTLKLTNNLPSTQALTSTISGPDAALFTPPADPAVNGTSILPMQVARVQVPDTTTVGQHTATLTITAPNAMPITTKNITLVQAITAPVLQLDMDCVDASVIGAHATLQFSAVIANTGNAVANVTVNPPTYVLGFVHATVSPSAFQIPPQGQVPLTITVSNLGGLSIVLNVFTIFTLTAPGECGPIPTLAIGCAA